ncbi:hypothetical protein Daesc_001293 [Daldinia eschscholtzii]|uniref:Phospholipase/carboxylesterase/thioesterase domain-containing protein n=1 Tax=Daldinia eschscholtzii TaxID=292717 RepID=A0AAX6N206_9PEZI
MSTTTQIVGPSDGHDHTHTIILLHGRGSSCDEFSSEFFESEASAPVDRPRTLPDLFPTIRFECMESQWFDMWSTEEPNARPEIQVIGLIQSIEIVFTVLREEETRISRDKIFLGGISQGFATAYCAYEMGEKEYASLIGFSSWAPLPVLALMQEHRAKASNEVSERQPNFVFLAHCRDDTVIPVEEGRKFSGFLKGRAGTIVEFHEYEDGGHWINEPQGVDDIVSFLRRRIT